MQGGAGNDIYEVDSLIDVVSELLNQGTDTIRTSLSYSLGDNVENLNLTGTGNISATGNSLNNSLLGNEGNNILTGGAGNDVMTGGGGVDQFVFTSSAAFTTATLGSDTISDLTAGTDKIVLDKTTFAALTSAVGSGFSNASEFAVVTTDAAASTSAARIIYNSDNGKLFYNQNGASSGLGAGGTFAVLSTKPALSSTDFVIQA